MHLFVIAAAVVTGVAMEYVAYRAGKSATTSFHEIYAAILHVGSALTLIGAYLVHLAAKSIRLRENASRQLESMEREIKYAIDKLRRQE